MEEVLSDRTTLSTKPPKSVLFVCNQNAVRSPMAQGLANHQWKRRVFVDSVGLIAGLLDPFSVTVMKELNINIATRPPRALNEIDPSKFDIVVALTPQSYDKLKTLLAGARTRLEYWPTFDPCDNDGNRDQVIEAYRSVRDQLEARIGDLLSFK